MGIEKAIISGVQATQSAIQKSSAKVQKASLPVGADSEKLTGVLQGLASSNSALVRKSPIAQLVEETSELLSGYVKKPLNEDLSNLSLKNMALVHVTDYNPKDGKILCSRSYGATPDGLSKPRTTVHFTANNISPEMFGDPLWKEKKFGIIIPANKVIDGKQANLLGGVPDDVMFGGDVKIPQGSVLIKYNQDIPKGKMKISASKELEGVNVFESSNPNMDELVQTVLQKTGYSTLPTNTYNAQRMGNWQNFAKQQGFIVDMHQSSPWGRAEALIDYIRNAGLEENSWYYSPNEKISTALQKKFDFFGNYFETSNGKTEINYKECFLDAIRRIKAELPKDKISYDIDELYNFIQESKTPFEAVDKIKSNLKLCPMTTDDVAKDNIIPNLNFIMTLEGLMATKQHEEIRLKQLCF